MWPGHVAPLSFCGYDRIWNSCICQSIYILIYVCGHPSASGDMTDLERIWNSCVCQSIYILLYVCGHPSASVDMTGFGIVVSVSLYTS